MADPVQTGADHQPGQTQGLPWPNKYRARREAARHHLCCRLRFLEGIPRCLLCLVPESRYQRGGDLGKGELEDQLYQPKNDNLLFAYFGISLTIRRRSMRTALRSRLAMKKRAEKVF